MSDRRYRVLASLGLLIVGLFLGILLVLLFFESTTERTQVVERVELGGQSLQPASAADSARAPVLTDIMTLNQMFKEVASHVTPAVVYIQVQNESRRAGSEDIFRFDGEQNPDQFFRDFQRESVGSGVIISDQGHIVTNEHVIGRADRISVTLADKRRYTAEVVGTDPSTDLAVLKIDSNRPVPVAALGNSSHLSVGEWVLAVGNPFRLTSTVTAGIVSALGRQVGIIDDRYRIEDFIQTDAAINPGNSGGALVNLDGELVGISTAIATESGSYEGYGFAVPVNLMTRVVEDIINYGEVRRGYLGVEIESVDSATADDLGLEEVGGVYVHRVAEGGAAQRAGMQSGDVIVAVGERRVGESNELQSEIAQFRPGDTVSVRVWRDGSERSLDVTLEGRDEPLFADDLDEPAPPSEEERPTPRAEPPESSVMELEGWGLGIRELSADDRDRFEVDEGAYIAYVEHGGTAARSGLPRGVVVTSIDEEPVISPEEARERFQAANPGEALLVRVMRPDGVHAFYEVEAPMQ